MAVGASCVPNSDGFPYSQGIQLLANVQGAATRISHQSSPKQSGEVGRKPNCESMSWTHYYTCITSISLHDT